MPDTTADKIDELLDKPRSVSADGLSVSQHPIPDLIALEKHRTRKSASPFGVRLGRWTPPAHIGEPD